VRVGGLRSEKYPFIFLLTSLGRSRTSGTNDGNRGANYRRASRENLGYSDWNRHVGSQGKRLVPSRTAFERTTGPLKIGERSAAAWIVGNACMLSE